MPTPKRKSSPARQRTRSRGQAKDASPKIPKARGKKRTPSEKTRTALEQEIAERKAAEEEIRALNENLERLVTERTRSLRKSEERYRYWMSTMPGAVYEFCIDAAGHRSLSFISKGIADLTGISSAEAMTDVEVLFQRIPPDVMPAMEQSLRASLESLAPWLHEFPIRATTGEVKWLRGHSVPRREKDGATCWTGVLVDITERMRAEEALQAAQEQVRQMQKMEAL